MSGWQCCVAATTAAAAAAVCMCVTSEASRSETGYVMRCYSDGDKRSRRRTRYWFCPCACVCACGRSATDRAPAGRVCLPSVQHRQQRHPTTLIIALLTHTRDQFFSPAGDRLCLPLPRHSLSVSPATVPAVPRSRRAFSPKLLHCRQKNTFRTLMPPTCVAP